MRAGNLKFWMLKVIILSLAIKKLKDKSGKHTRLSIITFNIQNFKFPAKFPGFLKIWDT